MTSSKHQKDLEAIEASSKVINEKYQAFLKEKVIFQAERDLMVSQIRSLEGALNHHQYKTMEDITNYKNQFNLKIEDLLSDLGKV
jgi:hypothetical protein